jgi:uncharacterized protein with NAD-binding domain and iron-sulfur cluster
MDDASRVDGFTRREAVQRAAAGGVVAATALTPASAVAAKRRRRRTTNGREVAVLGGGMAGLAAAHELVERGFRVSVYERKALGGKARSIPVPGTATGGRRALPGEHGFRFFPGFYHHVPTACGARRSPATPTASGQPRRRDGDPVGARERPGRRAAVRRGARSRASSAARRAAAPARRGGAQQQGITPLEAALFANRVMVFLTSCDERRYAQWEHTSWWDFVRAEGQSDEYKKVIASGLTRSLWRRRRRSPARGRSATWPRRSS